MNNKNIYSTKNIVIMIVFITMSLRASAQTELTTEMVWQEGTTWVYPYEYTDDLHGYKDGIFLRECRLFKYFSEDMSEYFLGVECRTNYSGKWNRWERISDAGIKIEGNKIMVYRWSNSISKLLPYKMYDFDTWSEGVGARFEDPTGNTLNDDQNSRTIVLENQQRVLTDPEGKYFSYAFSGIDNKVLEPYYFIKGIGRVKDYSILNLAFSATPVFLTTCVMGEPFNGLLAINVWHPDLGVLYQHPDYEHVMELAGADSLTADEAGEAVITAGSGEVTVESAHPVDVMICTTTGVTVHRDKVTGSATYPLAPGIYIVRAGSRTCKVCI